MKRNQEGGEMKCQWETILTAELTPDGVRRFIERASASDQAERRRPSGRGAAEDSRRPPGGSRRRAAATARTCR